MLLKKATGGTGISFGRKVYEWPADGAVTEVPDDLGHTLLAIHGAGYSQVTDEAPAKPAPAAPKEAPAAEKPAPPKPAAKP